MVRHRFDLDRPPPRPHPADDEFDAQSLDPKWTVVDGATGTVNLIGTSGGIYDLSTRPGWLLMQPDTGDHIQLRQDYTLLDGESVVAAVSITTGASGQSGITDSYLDCGIAVANDPDDWHADEWATVHLDTEVNGYRIFGGGGNAGSTVGRSTPAPNLAIPFMARRFYFRILRDSLDYYTFWSCDGSTWFPFSAVTLATAATSLWLFTQVDDSIPDPLPICGFDWVRIGGAGIDPW